MKFKELTEATYHRSDMQIIAEWLSNGLANSGWFDEWEEVLYSYAEYNNEAAYEAVEEFNICVDFINQVLGENIDHITDEEARGVIE
jgi:hypothetical protein